MKFRALALSAAVLSLVGVSLFACSSSSSAGAAAAAGNCPAVGSKACPNDNAITQADADECAKSKADATCGGKYVDYLKCAGSNVACDSGGKYDQTAGQKACGTQLTAYTQCVIGGSGDAGGGG